MAKSKVYIILLNYNGFRDTIECLESVLKLNYSNFQVVVVDNSDTQGPLQTLQQWAQGKAENTETQFKELVYPLEQKPVSHVVLTEKEYLQQNHTEKVIFIKANYNMGFAAGNNIGLRYALQFGGQDFYAWLLNNDTVVTKNALQQLLDYHIQSDKNIGILGSRLLYYYNPDIIQGVGGSFNTTTFIPGHIGEGYPANTLKSELKAISYPIGASMFVSSGFLRETGILSEDYFLYYEELDWTYRAKAKGYSIDWCPDAVIYHKEGGTIGTSSDYKKKSKLSDTEAFKSRKKFYSKFYGFRAGFYFFSLLIIANRIKRGQFNRGYEFFNILFKR